MSLRARVSARMSMTEHTSAITLGLDCPKFISRLVELVNLHFSADVSGAVKNGFRRYERAITTEHYA
jgi:hypothetical protein